MIVFNVISRTLKSQNVGKDMKREATMATIRSPKVSGTKNAGTGPYKAISGMGVPIHKPENILL